MNAILNLLFSLIPIILVIGGVVFWVYSKRRVRPLYRRLIGIGLILSPIFFYGFIFLSIFYVRTYDFSSERWNENKKERWRMGENLIESQSLIGKDSTQIKNLLSAPDQRNDSLHIWSYDMGHGGGGLGFCYHTLKITYKSGMVTKAEHNKMFD